MHTHTHTHRSTQPCIPPGSLNRVPYRFGWGKGGNVTSAGWQVTLCDPMWHVSSRSGVATLRTAIHLLLTYTHTRARSRVCVCKTRARARAFNGPFPVTTQVSRYQKGKPIWILLKQETVSGSGISWAICKSAPCSRQITTPAPHHSVFTGRVPFLPPNQQRQSTEGTGHSGLYCHCSVLPTAARLPRHALAWSPVDCRNKRVLVG